MAENPYASLSLTARFAIGLHYFARYCARTGLVHKEIDAILDDLWEFPLVLGAETWDEWESNHPALVDTGLGDEFPGEFEAFLRAHGVATGEFRELLENTVEIAFGSFYAAAEDANSLKHLGNVVRIVGLYGISPPPVDLFSASRFIDEHGWGNRLTEQERDAWRSLDVGHGP